MKSSISFPCSVCKNPYQWDGDFLTQPPCPKCGYAPNQDEKLYYQEKLEISLSSNQQFRDDENGMLIPDEAGNPISFLPGGLLVPLISPQELPEIEQRLSAIRQAAESGDPDDTFPCNVATLAEQDAPRLIQMVRDLLEIVGRLSEQEKKDKHSIQNLNWKLDILDNIKMGLEYDNSMLKGIVEMHKQNYERAIASALAQRPSEN